MSKAQGLMTRPRALVVIPTYNEATTVEEVLRGVRLESSDIDVLVVDDGSPDGTADLAEKVGADIGDVYVLRRDEKAGLGPAITAGFNWGLERDYDALGIMDADLQHDPRVVPELVDALANADLVLGSRYTTGGSIPNWSWHRRVLSRGGNRYSVWMLRLPAADVTSGFRMYRADLIRRLNLQDISASGYGFQIETVYRSVVAGARIAEVPIRFSDRIEGDSKMSGRIVFEAFWLVTLWGLERRRDELRKKRRINGAPHSMSR
jgi:dolichol-phosphate mannosyltransferase